MNEVPKTFEEWLATLRRHATSAVVTLEPSDIRALLAAFEDRPEKADCREALRVGYQVTLETQTLTDMAHDLVRLVRKGWAERDEAMQRAEKAEAERDNERARAAVAVNAEPPGARDERLSIVRFLRDLDFHDAANRVERKQHQRRDRERGRERGEIEQGEHDR